MKKLIFKYSLLALIAVTLAFIYVNSMLPPQVSSEGSGRVARLLAMIFPPDSMLGSFLITNVRKIAHFLEYAALGAEIAVYVNFYVQNREKWLKIMAVSGFFFGFVDETVQMFSGRGPSVKDVWIDSFGYCIFYAAVCLLAAVIRKIKASRVR